MNFGAGDGRTQVREELTDSIQPTGVQRERTVAEIRIEPIKCELRGNRSFGCLASDKIGKLAQQFGFPDGSPIPQGATGAQISVQLKIQIVACSSRTSWPRECNTGEGCLIQLDVKDQSYGGTGDPGRQPHLSRGAPLRTIWHAAVWRKQWLPSRRPCNPTRSRKRRVIQVVVAALVSG